MYATGTASTLADLLTAIQNACTSNGWTLSGNVLHKGNCYTSLAVSGSDLQIKGGTGIDVSNALTTPGPSFGQVGATHVPLAIVYPVTYHIHVMTAPDEVYVLLNHSTTYWQWLAFGISPVTGLPGTGGWYGASSSSDMTIGTVRIQPGQAGDSYAHQSSGALFGQNGHGGAWSYATGVTTYMHVGLDAQEWSVPRGLMDQSIGTGAWTMSGAVDAWITAYPNLSRQPNAWNAQTALLPIQPVMSRASSKLSQVGELGHARYCRNDNLADGEVITLGPDSWKVYPHVRKDATARDGGSGITHSGTFALAVRYDGP